ncbi:hypothetical protein ACER0A_002310 [Haloimpatiens sp. FM7315]|uniref:hypothetical protein n=1 Tax=Haloimpatiens sp. FM7315 TaxID=3298609 RepID=UPI0035A26CCE
MPKVTIVEPDITDEQNVENLRVVERALELIIEKECGQSVKVSIVNKCIRKTA